MIETQEVDIPSSTTTPKEISLHGLQGKTCAIRNKKKTGHNTPLFIIYVGKF